MNMKTKKIAIIGAGTGLGQGFLIKQGQDYYVYPSEGGHADFAPRTELEFQLLKYLLGMNCQVFATATHVSEFGDISYINDYKMFHVEHGAIHPV